MSLGITITSAVLVLLVTTPVVLIQQQQKKKERKLLNALKALANQHKSKLAEFEVFKNFAIGLDANNHNLFFYKQNSKKEISQRIDLNNIKSCGILNSKKANHTDKHDTIVRLQLVLNPKSSSKHEQNIEIFNQIDDFQLNGELEVIQKWEHIIQNNLN
ncbi:hypothetical protein [Psychroserpens damuponensis]|uniref:hypothetical protein n=1 Tax=Psychroserpens damuponensis TaxID=943936 RepID=UPI00058BC9DD|nr:hypothetical protein [Psychroserpens damuponensis]